MKWTEPQGFWLYIPLGVSFIFILIRLSRRSKALNESLAMMAREMGWSELRTSRFFGFSMQGMWNGYRVRIRRIPRQKSVPERIIANIGVQAPARVIITRRQRGVFAGRPMTLFGPPLVDLLPYSQQFWIRADEITLVERLLRSSPAAMLDRVLKGRFDVLRMGGDDLLIQRASTNDPDAVARLAREELELLRAIVDALALRP